MASDDEEYFIPLEDQRVFGAGIKRKRVAFVPSKTEIVAPDPPHSESTRSTKIGDYYLSLVMPSQSPLAEAENTREKTLISSEGPAEAAEIASGELPHVCEICHLPYGDIDSATLRPHEASLAHQVCLAHSHPPSHIDRARPGLKYLSSYGWDPDARVGLGAKGAEGISFPVKAKPKYDKLGVGLRVPKDAAEKAGDEERMKKKGRQKLDAKKIRKMDTEDRKRRAELQEQFYGSEDIERYLGPKS
jgi:G-patch domain